MGKGKKESALLEGMLASYRNARNAGDEEDETKWANNIGHLYKERGEYKLALQWFLKDYNISMKIHYSDPVKLMPTCQSIGEAHLRLLDFENALLWQRKHFHLAEEAADEPEEQRASTQLGRTYLEIFETRNAIYAVQDASRYLTISLKFAQNLKANPPSKELSPSGFVKELVDAYNNLGLLRMAVDDYTAAEKYYNQGLKICDEEELNENDDARSRLHHNLGQLYCELRQWERARHHTDMDIAICQRIPHAQGEAKGLVNQGILHLRALEFEKARMSFKRALVIAQSLQDETQLCDDIKGNLDVLAEAEDKSKQIGVLLQQQKKLRRSVEGAHNVLTSRTMIKQEIKLLLDVLSEAYAIKSWDVHLGMAKRLKNLAERLGDLEKLGDALDLIGISYYNLRNFSKAIKWHLKEWDVCNRINHLEGQIVAKINLGNCYDSTGDWEGALEAYQDAYRAASSKSTSAFRSQKINALENMHYCYSVRLEQLEDARRVELELQQLKNMGDQPTGPHDIEDERCSETDGEGGDEDVHTAKEFDAVKDFQLDSINARLAKAKVVISLGDTEEEEKCAQTDGERSWEDSDMEDALDSDKKTDTQESLSAEKEPEMEETHDDHATFSSLLSGRKLFPLKDICVNSFQSESKEPQKKVTTKNMFVCRKLAGDASRMTAEKEKGLCRKQQSSRRKKVQTVLSDDEENLTPSEDVESPFPPSKLDKHLSGFVEDSDDDSDLMEVLVPRKRSRLSIRHLPAKRTSTSSEMNVSKFSGKISRRYDTLHGSRSPSPQGARSCPSPHDLSSSVVREGSRVDLLSRTNEASKVESRRLRGHRDSTPSYLQCPTPVCGRAAVVEVNSPLGSLDRGTETISSALPETSTSEACKSSECFPTGSSCHLNEVNSTSQQCDEIASSSHDRVDKSEFLAAELAEFPVLLRYGQECTANGVLPNALLMNRLRSLKVSEDEVVASACNLTDKCARPFISALQENKTLTVLNLSHNQLGNGAVSDIQQLIKLTNQTDLGLTLDLHSNKLGAGALTQIAHCSVALSRLEVLNLSKNRLTDAAGRHLALILEGSAALATLSLESCGLTTRTVLKLIPALNSNSSLAKLCIGRNSPIDGYVLQNLLQKLSSLQCFAELDLKGLELDEVALTGICTLLRNSRSISVLNLEATDIRNDGAVLISETLRTATTRLAKLNLSGCGFHSEPAVKLCSQLMSVHSLTSLDLTCNDLDYQAALVIAEALSKSSCRLKVLNLSRCKIGNFGILSILNSLRDNTTLLDLKLAGNMLHNPASNQGRPPTEPSIPVRGHSDTHSETQTNPRSTADDAFVSKDCRSELLPIILPLAEDGTQFILQSEGAARCSMTGRNLHATASFVRFEEKATECLSERSDNLLKEKSTEILNLRSGQADKDIIPLSVAAEGFHTADEADRKSKEALCEDLCRTLLPLSSSTFPVALDVPVPGGEGSWKPWGLVSDGLQGHDSHPNVSKIGREVTTPFRQINDLVPVHVPLGDVARADFKYYSNQPPSGLLLGELLGSAEFGVFAGTPNLTRDPSVEEFALCLRTAKGLRRLDLSQNNLAVRDAEHLFIAWSAFARGKSLHQKHIEGDIAHYFVQEQLCECAKSPCCAAWSAT